MKAGDLAEGTRALALPVRGVRRRTHGVAQDTGVLFEIARLLLVMTRSLLHIARDHVVKMRSLRDNPRSPVVCAPALLFRAGSPSVLARVDVEAARSPRVVAPLRIVMSVPLSEVGHLRAEVARADRTVPGALDVGACVRDEAESLLRAITREARRRARLERAISPPRSTISWPRIPPSFRHLAPNSGRTPDASLRISPARVRLTSGDSSGQFATSAGVRNGHESRGPLLARRLEARTKTRNERRSS
jgi:hypothetical protein